MPPSMAEGVIMHSQKLNQELVQKVDHLKQCLRSEAKQLARVKLGFYGSNAGRDVGPLTHPLIWRTTCRFFWAWRSFSQALTHKSPSLGRQLEKMEVAAERLSSSLDAYDAGDRCNEGRAALEFLLTIREARDLVEHQFVGAT